MRTRLAALVFVIAAVMPNPARALVVFGFDAEVNNRFVSGFPSAPIANPSGSFIGAGFDFSGVGWQTGSTDFGVTLITSRHFVTARHVAPAVNSTVSFLNADGALRSYTVASVSPIIYHSPGGPSDLVVGTLSASIPEADRITSYPILYFGTPLTTLSLASYSVPPLLVYGKTGVIGTNTIEGFVNGDLYPQGSTDDIVDSLWYYMDYDATAGQSQGQGGDSGSPTFAVVNGALTLVGMHSAVATLEDGTQLTLDNFLAWPAILAQIAEVTGASGQSPALYVVAAIPEPSTIALILGFTALMIGASRRQHRRY